MEKRGDLKEYLVDKTVRSGEGESDPHQRRRRRSLLYLS
jgi:hypothetical protein